MSRKKLSPKPYDSGEIYAYMCITIKNILFLSEMTLKEIIAAVELYLDDTERSYDTVEDNLRELIKVPLSFEELLDEMISDGIIDGVQTSAGKLYSYEPLGKADVTSTPYKPSNVPNYAKFRKITTEDYRHILYFASDLPDRTLICDLPYHAQYYEPTWSNMLDKGEIIPICALCIVRDATLSFSYLCEECYNGLSQIPGGDSNTATLLLKIFRENLGINIPVLNADIDIVQTLINS